MRCVDLFAGLGGSSTGAVMAEVLRRVGGGEYGRS